MPPHQKKILIVGLPLQYFELCQQALKAYELVHSISCAQTHKEIENDSYHCLLINYELPDGSGLELLKALQNRIDPSIPILLMIPEGHEHLAMTAIHEGFTDYLVMDDLIPQLFMMVVGKAIEDKRWEKIYQNAGKSGSLVCDSVSGVFSRDYFEMRLAEELKRAERYQFDLSMILFNIDQFHLINDQSGYDAGDAMLSQVGRFFKKHLRGSDLIARIKDDQFSIILPHTSLAKAKKVWKRLMDAMGEEVFYVNEKEYPLKIRANIVPLTKEMQHLKTIFEHAEEKHPDTIWETSDISNDDSQ